MARTATTLGMLTVALLNVVVGLAMIDVSPRAFHVAVEILPWLLIASSLSMGSVLWRTGRTTLAVCLFANIAMLLAALFARLALGTLVPLRSILCMADLWWLNVHLIALMIIPRGQAVRADYLELT